jgi:hypothetical protein
MFRYPRRGTVRKTIRFLSSACALFLCFYLGAVLPLHHHDDGREHDDCSLCVAQVLPLVVTGIFFFAVFVSAWTEIFVTPFRQNPSRHIDCYHSRAPPVLISAS